MKLKRVVMLVAGLAVLLTSLIIFTTQGKQMKARIIGAQTSTYTACGCGGCGGSIPQEKVLYSKSEFERLKAEDRSAKGNPQCGYVGCSICTKYILKA